MPIEFECNICSRLLRVPEGSQGKPCKCPGCGERLTIPDDSPDDWVSDADVVVLVDVPCPKCKNVLQCDSALDGTRGCCPSCAHVFTISSQSKSSPDIVVLDSFPFACPKCNQLFEGSSDKLGKKGKCTNCKEVFIIQRYTPPKIESKASKRTSNSSRSSQTSTGKPTQPIPGQATSSPMPKPMVTKPVAAPVRANSVAAAQPQLASDPFADLSSHLPAASANYSVPSYSAPSYSAPMSLPQRSSSYGKKRKSGQEGGGTVRWILGIVGGIAIAGLLLCGGAFGLIYLVATSKTTLTASNYTAKAPGRVANMPNPPKDFVGMVVKNSMTGSEFTMGFYTAPNGQKITPELFLTGMKMTGTVRVDNTSTVNRAGLVGVRWTGAVKGNPTISEIYDSPNGILLLAYECLLNHPSMASKRRTMTEERAAGWDKPDEFFESLEPK